MVSEEFKRNVETGNVSTVRNILVDYLILDTTFRTFQEALDYAKGSLDIMEPYDGQPFKDESEWDKRYLNRLKVDLRLNFSQERIDHLQEVIRKVLGTEEKKVSETSAQKPHQASDSTGKRTGRRVVEERPLQEKETEKDNHSDEKGNGLTGKDVVCVVAVGAITIASAVAASSIALKVGAVVAGTGVAAVVIGGKKKGRVRR